MRGCGKSSTLMQSAPQGSLYIWPNSQLDYPKQLAQHLGRGDLVIVNQYNLTENTLRAKNWPGIAIDHAANLNDRQKQWVSQASHKHHAQVLF